jgi:hypothetical protein
MNRRALDTISTFPAGTTGTVSFSFNLLSFSFTRRAPAQKRIPTPDSCRRGSAIRRPHSRFAAQEPLLGSDSGASAGYDARTPRNPEKCPGFPRTRQRWDEYNQKQGERAVSAQPQSVVECGQHRICLNPVFEYREAGSRRTKVGLCRPWKLKWRSQPRRGQRWRLP